MADELDREEGVVTRSRPSAKQRLKEPRMYKVLLHNDDFTTREFVVQVLKAIFHKSDAEAVEIMLKVHNSGVGVAGVFTREVAETKIATVEHLAQQFEYPLKLTMEPED